MRLRMWLSVAVGLAATTAPPAFGHTGEPDLVKPILERVEPEVAGLQVRVAYSANYQFVVNNPTATELVILADTGEPFLRIGPNGVFGNLRSKSWYDANAPEGLLRFPPEAKEGVDVPSDWKLIARQPSYGWFDHRLHPVERYVAPEVKRSRTPVTLGHWKVPIRYGDKKGEIGGRFEFQPVFGSYRSVLVSPEAPAEGVKVQVAPSSSGGGVPALFVENRSPETVTILGGENEPFVRLGPKAEVNVLSPTWVAIQQGRGLISTAAADAKAEPRWKEVQASPRWGWPELRAAPPQEDPAEVAARESRTTVKKWAIPLLIGERRTEIAGITEFVPTPLSHRDITGIVDDGGDSKTPFMIGGAAVILAAIGGFLILRRVRRPATTRAA